MGQHVVVLLEAAAAAKKAKDSAKAATAIATAIAKRAPLKEKRVRDLRVYGNNSNQERDAALELKTCADKGTTISPLATLRRHLRLQRR